MLGQVIRNLSQQLLVFFGQFLLLQVDQLSQTHSQDFIGLYARERVPRGFAAFQYELLKPFVAQGTLHHGGGALNPHQTLFGLSGWILIHLMDGQHCEIDFAIE